MTTSAYDLAHAERAALADLFEQVGPDVDTLCEGWTARDLAAHLIVRESRPDAALGILGGPLAGWTGRVQSQTAARDWPDIVGTVRSGPPTLSLFRLPWVDGQANAVEYFVHHEDVRRGRPGWTERTLDADLADYLWSRVTRMGRLMFRRSPVGVELVRTDGASEQRAVVKDSSPKVTVHGSAGELILRAFGRTQTSVRVEGAADDVAAFEGARLGM